MQPKKGGFIVATALILLQAVGAFTQGDVIMVWTPHPLHYNHHCVLIAHTPSPHNPITPFAFPSSRSLPAWHVCRLTLFLPPPSAPRCRVSSGSRGVAELLRGHGG